MPATHGQALRSPPPQVTLTQSLPEPPAGSMGAEQEEIQVRSQESYPIYFARKLKKVLVYSSKTHWTSGGKCKRHNEINEKEEKQTLNENMSNTHVKFLEPKGHLEEY